MTSNRRIMKKKMLPFHHIPHTWQTEVQYQIKRLDNSQHYREYRASMLCLEITNLAMYKPIINYLASYSGKTMSVRAGGSH